MADDNRQNKVGMGLNLAMIGVVIFIVVVMIILVFRPSFLTVGGSFGAGFPGGSGGSKIRDVEIDVEPQVVYRIDDHRFFTLEKYVDCSYGGFVYYNDTKKGIKVFAGMDGQDKKPQDEFTISQPNSVMAFRGSVIYSASDDLIAYPGRIVGYKYGDVHSFILYRSIGNSTINNGINVSDSSYNSYVITDDAIFVRTSDKATTYLKHKITDKSDDSEIVSASSFKFGPVSIDDRFHCDKNIKPKKIRYIDN